MSGNDPIYIHQTTTVAEYAEAQRERMLALGCSAEFAESRKQEVLDRGVLIKNAFESNAAQSGRAKLQNDDRA